MKRILLTFAVLFGGLTYAQDQTVTVEREQPKVEFTTTGSVTSHTDSGIIVLEEGGRVDNFFNLKFIEASGVIEINPENQTLVAHGVTRMDWFQAPVLHMKQSDLATHLENRSVVVEYMASGDLNVSFEE
ncbi:MAG: hypothetical protein EP346_08220 [Bacteroidetes bacterium]|uniref:Uncharacterized protein n=1 Tax=Phaeocystidibacter marisrubri TaxID=1577780 RepID=A0A6L3ZHQ2_9FLAO|nr:hypothetical protein [Phaeocystidibacter marisrubri]KAB2817163.1 hypothetical protein F8C82_01835 [Phaeocystidibacter marisrubri]TNE28752.1 MAG: hypothetical protein EP346_08220 [Bacteroidota bacterium]GGH76602.1 hypothetical protein GCM10011318_25110 [Phaeocystidibacter marisrubri]